MFAFRSASWAIHFALALTLAGCSCGRVAAQDTNSDREKLISWFRHQEELVISMYAEFENVQLPTTLEQAAVIRQILHERKQDNIYERTLMTPERARNLSYIQQWWRKGAKERFNSYYGVDFDSLGEDLIQRRPGTTLAYDGQIVRTLNPHDESQGGSTGSIASEQKSNWNRINRETPFSMLYGYCEVPYSRLIQEAATFHSTLVNRDGKRLLLVSFDCSGEILGNESLVLLFDEQHRLVERQEFEKVSTAKAQLYRRQFFSDYRRYSDPSGETIWFPHQAIYKSYVTLLNGSTLETGTKRVRIRAIQFNIDIMDDFFELKIPKNAKINDGVTGRGWLPEGERPDVLFPHEAKVRRWTWAIIGTLTAILVLALVFVVVRRRRNASRISPASGGH